MQQTYGKSTKTWANSVMLSSNSAYLMLQNTPYYNISLFKHSHSSRPSTVSVCKSQKYLKGFKIIKRVPNHIRNQENCNCKSPKLSIIILTGLVPLETQADLDSLCRNRLVSNSQRSACFCLMTTRIKDINYL